jgi:hypothetical protein
MPKTPSPKQLAKQAIHDLAAAANVRTARQVKTYFKPGEEVWVINDLASHSLSLRPIRGPA